MEKQRVKLNNEQIKNYVEKFMKVYRDDDNSRYRSYDYARKIFLENRNKNDDDTIDKVALNLFAFLGSWGMICRGAILMLKDYKFLKPVVKILNNSKYDYLLTSNPLSDDFNEKVYINEIISVVDELNKYFKGEKYYKIVGEPITDINATQTLIGKILMVTLGCVPAYDTYVCIGLKAEDVCGTLGKKSCKDLITYCRSHKAVLSELSKKIEDETHLTYPVMKIVDMVTWEYGYDLDTAKEN